MAKLINQEGRVMYGVEEWIADSVEELQNNDFSLSTPGSTCLVITQNETKEGEALTATVGKYILTLDRVWVKISESIAEAIVTKA